MTIDVVAIHPDVLNRFGKVQDRIATERGANDNHEG